MKSGKKGHLHQNLNIFLKSIEQHNSLEIKFLKKWIALKNTSYLKIIFMLFCT